MMTGQSFWVCGAMAFLTTVAFAAEPAFQFSRDIQPPTLEQEELLSVPLDANIYEATQDDFDDFRLLDDAGQPVPFVVRRMTTSHTETIRQNWTADAITARPLEDGGLEITVVLGHDDPAPSGLRLVTPLDDFAKRLRVETSVDGRQWEAVAQSPIFDYSRYVDVRRDSVSFPKTTRRHIRILIDNVTATQESELLELTRHLRGTEEINRQERVTLQRRPFRIDRVEFWSETLKEVPDSTVKKTYPVSSFRVEQDAEVRETHIMIDMRREPLTSLAIETPKRNFSRRALVQVDQVDGVQRRWKTVGEGTLTRIDFKDFQRERLSITFPETRRSRFRLVIANQDSPPLEITGVTATGNIHELIFLATPEQSVRLVYGDPEAKPAEYDTAALQELLRSGFAPRSAELGEQEPHAAEGADAFHWPAFLNSPLFLVGVIGVLVIVLGLGLYRAARRLDGPDHPTNAP